MKYCLNALLMILLSAQLTQAQGLDCSPAVIEKLASDAMDQMLVMQGPKKITVAVSALKTIRDACEGAVAADSEYACIGNQIKETYLRDSGANADTLGYVKVGVGIKVGLLEKQIYPISGIGDVSSIDYVHIKVLSGPLIGTEGYVYAPKYNYTNFNGCF